MPFAFTSWFWNKALLSLECGSPNWSWIIAFICLYLGVLILLIAISQARSSICPPYFELNLNTARQGLYACSSKVQDLNIQLMTFWAFGPIFLDQFSIHSRLNSTYLVCFGRDSSRVLYLLVFQTGNFFMTRYQLITDVDPQHIWIWRTLIICNTIFSICDTY